MSNLVHIDREISQAIKARGARAPQELFQRYNAMDEKGKEEFVLALLGKALVSDRRLARKSHD